MAKMTSEKVAKLKEKLAKAANDLRALSIEAARVGTEYLTDNDYEPHLGAQCFELAKLSSVVCDKMTDTAKKVGMEAGLGGLADALFSAMDKGRQDHGDCDACPDKEKCEQTDPVNQG